MKISVVITSYNHAAFIGEAIESVLDQTVKPQEIVVVDDCSTDDSMRVIKEYSSHVRVIQNINNLGGSRTTSIGVETTTGEYVGILNSDDKWHNSKLEKQLLFMAEKQLDCSFTTATVIDGLTKPLDNPPREFDVFQRKYPINGNFLYHFLHHGNFLCHSSMVAKRNLFARTGPYDHRLKQLPDFAKWIEFAKVGKIGIIPEDLTMYRYLGPRNASSIASTEVAIRTKFEYLLVLENFFTGLSDETLADLAYQSSNSENEMNRGESIIQILLSIESSPLREIGRLAALSRALEQTTWPPSVNAMQQIWDSVVKS
jgi:glycosyltransferase involved in cell wall biosynthesis